MQQRNGVLSLVINVFHISHQPYLRHYTWLHTLCDLEPRTFLCRSCAAVNWEKFKTASSAKQSRFEFQLKESIQPFAGIVFENGFPFIWVSFCSYRIRSILFLLKLPLDAPHQRSELFSNCLCAKHISKNCTWYLANLQWNTLHSIVLEMIAIQQNRTNAYLLASAERESEKRVGESSLIIASVNIETNASSMNEKYFQSNALNKSQASSFQSHVGVDVPSTVVDELIFRMGQANVSTNLWFLYFEQIHNSFLC